MLNFQVPQFIEVEDKIFGPLTFRQFIYVVGGAGASFMLWVYLPYHWLAIILMTPILGLAFLLAFYKVNNRSFILILEAAFHYIMTHKLYLWQHKEAGKRGEGSGAEAEISNKFAALGQEKALNIPKLSESKLKDLSWSLDVREKIK